MRWLLFVMASFELTIVHRICTFLYTGSAVNSSSGRKTPRSVNTIGRR